MQPGVQLLKQDNEVVAINFRGWDAFQDLMILSRESLAKQALARLIDYCSRDLSASVAQFTKISRSNEFNPHDLDDLSDIIMRLGVEVFFACFEYRLFEIGGPRDLPFELYHVGPYRLYLRRLTF